MQYNQESAAPLADATCSRFSAPNNFDLGHFDLKIIALPTTPDVSNLSSKFERCVIFRFRVNGAWAGMGETHGQT